VIFTLANSRAASLELVTIVIGEGFNNFGVGKGLKRWAIA